ncbi:RING-H2 finger protein ATL16-like [Phragmites australis]|uniref:RING-H2 finger protein ATL16-like n=1 Tax=Phragmites australis TaxID=29695 RepID=UPI002D79DE49|nr:RING-H2 finger protein ATL16-like [Phragmites australis]
MDATATTSSPSSSSPGTSFLILSVSIVGILGTSLLLLAYYLFLTRCGLLFFWRWRPDHHITAVSSVTVQEPELVPRSRGLEEAAIRRIPTFRYRNKCPEVKASDCAVCLAEFRDGERLRLLPPCLHAFHIDCIDAWLQASANCPLCRAALSSGCLPLHHLVVPSAASTSAGQDRRGTHDIVIDIISSAAVDETADVPPETAQRRNERNNCCSSSTSLGGDGCFLGVQQPMRRSLSMDSCSDKRFYLALQRILQQQQQQLASPVFREEEEDGKAGGESSTAGSGRSRRLRRSFFSFSQSRGS